MAPKKRAKTADGGDPFSILDDMPIEMRQGEHLSRVGAVLFASAGPVDRDTLLRVTGPQVDLEAVLATLTRQVAPLGVDLVRVGECWRLSTRASLGPVVRHALRLDVVREPLTKVDIEVLAIIAYHQPTTRAEIAAVRGKEARAESLERLLALRFIRLGPRRSSPGHPETFLTTDHFLDHFGLASLSDLPDADSLAMRGLLDRRDVMGPLGLPTTGTVALAPAGPEEAGTDAPHREREG